LSVEFQQPLIGIIRHQVFSIKFVEPLIPGVGVNVVAIHLEYPLVARIGGDVALAVGTIAEEYQNGCKQCFHVLVFCDKEGLGKEGIKKGEIILECGLILIFVTEK
jgi:hypothetical protein